MVVLQPLENMSNPRVSERLTPGRRRNVNKENVYFEPGKYGRRTGVTLKDTGVRDEHGFEPVSGIFSSPIPQPETAKTEKRTRKSFPMETTLQLTARKTPKIPIPRSQSPKKTNMRGSPLRNSTIFAGAKHAVMLQDEEGDESSTPSRMIGSTANESAVINSTEDSSNIVVAQPLAKKIRKSIFDVNMSPLRRSPSANPSISTEAIMEVSNALMDDVIDTTEIEQIDDSAPHDSLIEQSASTAFSEQEMDPSLIDPALRPQITGDKPNTKRKRESLRRSAASMASGISPRMIEAQSSVKRRKIDHDSTTIMPSPSQRNDISTVAQSHKSPAQILQNDIVSTSMNYDIPPIDDDVPAIDDDFSPIDDSVQPIDDDLRPMNDQTEMETRVVTHKKGNRRKSVVKPSRSTKKNQAASVRSRDREKQQRNSNSGDGSDSEADGATRHGNTRLRATTPMADSGSVVTRTGRAVIKPLAYWKNETFVYRNGEIDGVIRAEDVETKRKRPTTKKRKKTRVYVPGDDEEEIHDDLLPDVWEEDDGVLIGKTQEWDPMTESVTGKMPLEKLAVASTSWKTRPVANGEFKYSKIINYSYFGTGMVEMPPKSIKRLKNSTKWRMVFFIHEGKVEVTVANTTFGLTQGGMFHVPPGNNYSIENKSKIFESKIFFAQGTVDDPEGEEETQTTTR